MAVPLRSLRSALTAGACATVMILAGALSPAPAQALPAKATTNCSPGVVNPSFPTPVTATDVSATKFGAVKGKEKVSWTAEGALSPAPAGYNLYFQILTSNGQCTKPMMFVLWKCLKEKKESTNYSCKIKRLRSGSTEFRVALWYQNLFGAWGPVTYSDWSASVKVK